MAKYRNEFLSAAAGVAGALADPGRLRIVNALTSGELCVCQITRLLGLATSTVSKHLAVLRQAGLVESRKEGRWIYYRLAIARPGSVAGQALSWALAGRGADPMLAEDQRQLAEIRELDLEVLCCQLKS